MQRQAIEAQIRSYGQSPKQLFTSPHPQRTTHSQLAFSSAGGPEHFDRLERMNESQPLYASLESSVHDFNEAWNQFAFLGRVKRCVVGVLWRKAYAGPVGSIHLPSSGDAIVTLAPNATYVPAENAKGDGAGLWGIVSWAFYDGSVRVRLQKSANELCLPSRLENLEVQYIRTLVI